MSEEGGGSKDIVGVKPPDIRELTLRSILVGIIVAAIMGASYPYIVLKLGFGPNVSVVAAFFGYLILGVFLGFIRTIFARLGAGKGVLGLFRDFNRWENNIVETAGTAASQTAFMCVLLAAFDMLAANPKVDFHFALTPMQSFPWLTAAGILGVLLAAPLRQHYVVDEKLTYADGVAAGETLIVLDSKGPEGRRAAAWLGAGGLISALHFALREESLLIRSFLGRWKLPGGLPGADPEYAEPGHTLARFFPWPDDWVWGPPLLKRMHVGVAWSMLSLGSGALVGLRINISMMLGATMSWVIAPLALTSLGWIVPEPKRNEVLFWVMWPATGMLVAGGMTALALRWKVLIRTFKSLGDARLGSQDFPLKWVGLGVAIAAPALIFIQWVNLGIPMWMTALSIILSVPLMLVGLRVLGETNWGPISALSNMMQGVFAAVAPGNLAINMVASGTTGTIATSSEAIMQDYKAGHMLGTTARNLTIVQLFSVPIGAAAVSWMYPYLRDTYGIVGESAKLSSPISAKWAGFAAILKGGKDALPPNAVWFLLIFAVLGVILTILEDNKTLKTFVPSPTGVGIGMLVPFHVISTMFVGGLMGWAWEKKDKRSSDLYATPLASGLIAGEAILAVIVPLLVALGYVHVD